MRATSRDVARLAGVAQSTVSYALNGKGPVSAETKAKVLAAAKELHYQPNLAARSMRAQRTNRIAVVLGITSTSAAQMISGATEAAEAAGFTIEVRSVEGRIADRSDQVARLAHSGQFEGILSFVPVLPAVESRSPSNVPIMVPGTYNSEMQAGGDLAHAGPIVEMIEHLAELGHRRFLHIAGLPSYVSAAERIATYRATIDRFGLESLGVVGHDWTGQAGMNAINALPDDAPPLAVIAANDLVALGALRAATLRGWSVPGDMSLTGWDDREYGKFLLPSLTTVHVDRVEGGRREMNRLLALMDGVPPAENLPPLTSLIWRDSTGAPNASRPRQKLVAMPAR
ncbi:MAG: LacI family transcriptional regulator [Promicromonosporaceae bacterium]|nr:LacI family transcriptional regulator [Promicromonosporaceae bacterium]